MAKAIIWCRVSTTEQEFETQKVELIEKAKKDGFLQEQLIVIGEAGASAIKMNDLYQREVNQLITAVETDPEITTIYVWEISRLARNEVAFYEMKDMIIKNRIQLICNVPQLRLLDDDGEVNNGAELTLSLLLTLAKQEMEIKSRRFARGRKRLAEQGKYNGGAIPYGYKVDKDRDNLIVIDEEVEAPIVREVFDMYERGYSQKAIAVEMFNRGVKGRSARRTKGFTISLVHQLLTNRLLTGEPQPPRKGSRYVRQYPQIITTEQFDRCRKIAEINNTSLPKSKYIHYAHGLLKCKECGRNFVSTGQKGYYHCQDAWNANKKYDGYYGMPQCQNRMCISTNIMDSLLWELGKKYETIFIMEESEQKLDECKKKTVILQQKLDAIPSLLGEIEKRMDTLYDAYAEGMKKENFLKRKQALLAEEKEVRKNEAEYKEELERNRTLEEEIIRKMQSAYDVDVKKRSFQRHMDSLKVIKRISEITDDAERSKIIHRNIEKVIMEEATITYATNRHPEGKEVLAKKITVYPFLRTSEVFYFYPNGGHNGVILQKDGKDGYRVLPMQYLKRISDKWKKAKRELVRAKREEIRTAEVEELRKEGYISLNEMREISGLSDSTLRYAISGNRLKAKNVLRTWYAKKKDFVQYLEEYKPQPRPERQKYRIEKGYDKEERMKALLEEIHSEDE